MTSTAEFFQVNSNAVRDVAEGVNRLDPTRLNRQRSLWSFLTRAFFLGQVIVAEQFIAGGAQASHGDDVSNVNHHDGADSSGAGNGSAASLPGSLMPDDPNTAGAATSSAASLGAQALPPGAELAGLPSVSPGAVDGVAAGVANAGAGILMETKAVEAGSDAVLSDPVTGFESPLPGDGGHGIDIGIGTGPGGIDVGIGAGPIDVGLGVDLDHGIAIDLGVGNLLDLDLNVPLNVSGLTNPVFDLLDNTVVTTTALVNGALDGLSSLPVLGDVLGTVHDLGGSVISTAAPLLDGAISIADTAFDLVDHTVDTVVSPIVSTTLQTVGDVGGSVLAAASPVLGGASSALNGLADTAESVTGSLPIVGDIVGSSGVISLATSTVSAVSNPDTLFEGGKYTDFNISLQADVPETVGGAAQSAASAADSVLDGVIDIATGHEHDSGHGLGVVSHLTDAVKGGLGDLFA